MKFLRKSLCLLLALTMLAGAFGIEAFALSSSSSSGDEPEAPGYTVTKISNPDSGEREVDGLVEGGDRENSYTWRLAERGDYIYIATTRNIASALVNMYAGAFEEGGIDLDTFWALINTVTNGDIPRNDANEGANIIRYCRADGTFEVIYTADQGDYFRMAVTFGDDVYFGSYSAVPTNPQYILKLDSEENFTKVFETTGSVSLRANCVYDDHLFFAGADDRETVPEGEQPPVAKMAVLRKSNEDDTVWERVADYKDFGTTAYDPIHESWAGAPIWELASHDGYIFATAPTMNGFVIYKGRPAEEGETANEYGWIWTEVAGLTNGVNNPGLSEIEGGEPGTMRSLIGSVYEFNGELYAYNFDHAFGGEAAAFAGMLQQLAGQDVKASDYLFYLYNSLHNPQKVWKLNDETGQFEELEEFTKLMEGTTNEYIWRLGDYDGQLYISTMDAGIFYGYLTQLTNGSFFRMTREERKEKLQYVKDLITLIAADKVSAVMSELKAKLEEIKYLLENFDPEAEMDEATRELLMKYYNLKESLSEIVAKVKEELANRFAEDIVDEITNGDADLAEVGAVEDEAVESEIDSYIAEITESLQDLSDLTIEVDVEITIDPEQLKAEIIELVKTKLAEAQAKLEEEKAAAQAKLEEVKAAVQAKIDEAAACAQAKIEAAKACAQAKIEAAKGKIDEAKICAQAKLEEFKATVQALAEQAEACAQAKLEEAKALLEAKIIELKEGKLKELQELVAENIAKLNEKFEEMKAGIAEKLQKLEELKEKAVEIWNSIDWKGIEMYAYINALVMKDDWGFDLYRTSDCVNFETITNNGFNDKYNYGCSAFLATEEGMYIGTCNPFYGGQLYLLTNGEGPGPEPVETGYTVKGSVTTYLSEEAPISIELKSSKGWSITTEMPGNETEYEFYDNEPGDYTLIVSKKDHVTREYSITVTDSDVVQDVKICPLGDVNNDGKTTQTDYVLAMSYVRKTKDLEEYQIACGDVFGTPDGKLTAQDATRIVQHTRKVKYLYEQ